MSAPSTAPWGKQLQATAYRSKLHQVCVANKSAAAFWVWICDSAAGATAQSSLAPHYVAANSREFFDFGDNPRLLESGVYVAACPLPSAFGLIAADDAFIEVVTTPFPIT